MGAADPPPTSARSGLLLVPRRGRRERARRCGDCPRRRRPGCGHARDALPAGVGPVPAGRRAPPQHGGGCAAAVGGGGGRLPRQGGGVWAGGGGGGGGGGGPWGGGGGPQRIGGGSGCSSSL